MKHKDTLEVRQMVQNLDFRVEMRDITNIEDIGEMWCQLETNAIASYFQTWAWIGMWLRLLPESIRPKILVAWLGTKVVGLAVFVPCKHKRNTLLVPSRALYMNQVGNVEYDTITIEYNGILADKKMQEETVQACLTFLHKNYSGWDEIVINGVDSSHPMANADIVKKSGLRLLVTAEVPSRYVDLQELREEDKNYLDSLSSNTRYQLRRSIRECEKFGELKLIPATDADMADSFLDGLIKYHQIYWKSRGSGGSFMYPYFEKFHRKLIKERFAKGEIQVLRACIDNEDLGYVYNLVKDGYVNFYQSGFNYDVAKKIKPGLITHYLAIEHNYKLGMNAYDFLASECRYKQSLSTKSNDLVWISIQQERFIFRLERGVRYLYENAGLRRFKKMIPA